MSSIFLIGIGNGISIQKNGCGKWESSTARLLQQYLRFSPCKVDMIIPSLNVKLRKP
jgi:hypothetical protein